MAKSVEGQSSITVSVGIAGFDAHTHTPFDQALVTVDHAMYRDKQSRRS